jgi:ribosomal-protein-alanine N-acetyltransferase
VPIETPSLTLLPSSPEHLLVLIEEPHRFEEFVGLPVEDALRGFLVSDYVSPNWLASLRDSSGPDPWRYGFFVAHRERNRVIGTAGFKGPPDTLGLVEIAYGIVPAFEGRGYATEAAAALVEFALATPEVRTIRAHTMPEANASTHVLRKCGFKKIGAVEDPEDGTVWRWERPR